LNLWAYQASCRVTRSSARLASLDLLAFASEFDDCADTRDYSIKAKRNQPAVRSMRDYATKS
jgi:hypothetical protein